MAEKRASQSPVELTACTQLLPLSKRVCVQSSASALQVGYHDWTGCMCTCCNCTPTPSFTAGFFQFAGDVFTMDSLRHHP